MNFGMHILLTGLLARLASPLATDPSYVGPSTVREGVPFTLECQLSIFATGQWTMNGELVRWARMSEELTNYNQRIMTLQVSAATPEHQGEYRCNRWSRKSHSLRIIPVENKKVVEWKDPIGAVMSLKIGETIRLQCEMETDGSLPINWYKNEHLLSPRSDLKIEGGVVTIQNARPSDSGRYMCSVSSTWNALEKGWIIQLQYPASVVPLPVEMESLLGDNLTLECRAFGHPEPQISWLIGNVDVHRERNSRLSLIPSMRNSQRLFIRWVEFADRDLYTCRAENELGTDETSTFLKVKESTIQTNAKDYTGILLMALGQPLTLQCNTTEDSEWKVIWFKDDKRIENTDPRRKIHEDNNSLVIQVAEEGDAGEYMCIVQGHKVKKIISASIFVQKRRLSIWVNSTENPEFAVLTPGGNLTIRCQTDDPDRGVLWYKDGEFLSKPSGNLFFLENTSLSIIKGDPNKDTGDYMCVARAKRLERLMNATVAVRTAPQVHHFHKSETVVEGSSLDLLCQVTAGIPQPVVTWFKDGVPFEDEEMELSRDEKGIENAHLLIKKVQLHHRAQYTCSADNGVAQANATTLLRVRGKFAALWPFLGILVELVILVVVIAVHEKRKIKPDIDDQLLFPQATKNKETMKTKVN